MTIAGFLAVRENLENSTFFSKSQGKPGKVRGKKSKIMTKSGKSQGIFSVISLFFICLNLTYNYPFSYQYILVSLSMSTFSFMPCLLASLSFEGASVNIFN